MIQSNTALKAAETLPFPQQPKRAADRLVQGLIDRDVDRVFGIPGGTISPVFNALAASDIEVTFCQHETMAVYLAYGYARATGRPGAVLVTSGPGILNALTGLAAAYQDEVPLIVMAGEVVSSNHGRGAIQDGSPAGLDVMTMVRPVTKFLETLSQPERAGLVVQQALDAALQHPRGPAFLRLPLDVAQRELPLVGYAQALPSVGPADDETCSRIADLLHTAERPLIFLGHGARMAQVGPVVTALAERGRIPVMTDIEAKGEFPESHPMSLRMFGVGGSERAHSYLEQGVDAMLVVGARLDDTTTNGFSDLLAGAGTTVQLDYDPRRLCRAYTADLAICCEPSGTLARVADLLPKPKIRTLLLRDAAVREAVEAESQLEPALLDGAPFDPAAVVRALQETFESDTVFTSDIGNHLLFAARHLLLDEPGRFHVSNGLGGMGSGIGTAMGLAAAYRDAKTVVGICGDGGLLMVGNELATCAKHGIPVVLAVFNNGSLGMVDHGFERIYGQGPDCSLPETDLTTYARALGVEAVRVTSIEDLKQAASRAGKGPLVLDIPIRNEVQALNPRDETLNFSAQS